MPGVTAMESEGGKQCLSAFTYFVFFYWDFDDTVRLD